MDRNGKGEVTRELEFKLGEYCSYGRSATLLAHRHPCPPTHGSLSDLPYPLPCLTGINNPSMFSSTINMGRQQSLASGLICAVTRE